MSKDQSKIYEIELDTGCGNKSVYVMVSDSANKVYRHFLEMFKETKLTKYAYDIKEHNSAWALGGESEESKRQILLTAKDLEFDIEHQGTSVNKNQGIICINQLLVWYCLKNKITSDRLTTSNVKHILTIYAPLQGVYLSINDQAVFL